MSNRVRHSETAGVQDDDTDEDWIEAHRAEIEREADADHAAAWVFQRMLDGARQASNE